MRYISTLACCVSALALASQANAQVAASEPTGDENTLSEIVVTAAKGAAQTLVEAPMAVQVFSGEELAAKGITTTDALITAIPGASQGEQLGEFIRTYSIRGSGTGGGIGDALVGYYIDDTAFIIPNAQFAPPIRLVDLERVEVLRGPYGTLYGSGAMGGTIIFHTRDPSLTDFDASGEAYVSDTKEASDANYGISGGVSIPIINDKLGLRISGGRDYRAGYADVYSGLPVGAPRAKDANDSRKYDLRAALLFAPNDRLTARLSFMHFDGKQGYSQQMSSVKPPYFAGYGDVEGFEESNNNIYGATINYDLGFATLTSATGYAEFHLAYLTGLVNPVLGQGRLGNSYDGHSFTQEVRLASNGEGPLNWVAGAFYNDATGTFGFDLDFAVPIINVIGTTTTATENYSFFGEVSYDLFGGKLVPLAGIRLYNDDRGFVTNAVRAAGPATSSGNSDASVTTWRANLSYHPTDDLTAYFNAGTGFRSGITQSQGQVDALATDGIIVGSSLPPDRMRNLELGLKGRLRALGMTFETNLYDLRYTDIQTGLTTSIQLAAFAPIGDAKIQGLDMSVQWMPIAGLTLSASGDVNKARYTYVNPAVSAGAGVSRLVAKGERLLNHPAWTARFDVGYVKPINDNYRIYANTSLALSDSRIGNQAGIKTAKTSLVDATVGVRHGDYDVELFGQNLTDERGPWFVRSAGQVGGPVPRTIGVRVRANFN